MKRISREVWWIVGLLTLFLLVTVVAAVQQARQSSEEQLPLSVTSTRADGARALWLWLDALGYPLSDQVGAVFRIPGEARLALILEPWEQVRAAEWHRIDSWVSQGGTLILAGSGWSAQAAFEHYEVALIPLREEVDAPLPQSPLLDTPPLSAPPAFRPRGYFFSDRDDLVPLLTVASLPVLVSLEQGEGRVLLCAGAEPFTNAGLHDRANAELVLNLVAAAGPDGLIWFDEWHHGRRPVKESGAGVGPADWLRRTPPGHALLYAVAVILLALFLQGRRFGRPLPLSRHAARRAPLEYITAVANLSRRAGHRRATLEQYRHHLKRELGRRYRLDPSLPDEAYVEALARYNPLLDAPALQRLLRRLRAGQVGEGEFVRLSAQVAQWLEEVL